MLHTSVIMVSYHTGPVLWVSLESVLSQKGLKELILVDNGNPEYIRQCLQALARRDSRVTLLTGHGNVGFARGCNMGVAKATAEYILLLNPDCLLPENALEQTYGALTRQPSVWLAGCNLVSPDGCEQAGGRRNLLTPWKALVEGLKLYKMAPNHPYFSRVNLHEQTPLQEGTIIPAISGAFMAISRERYQVLQGMDEAYFLHVEDLDFCYRVREHGGDIIYLPDVRVIHYRSTSKAPACAVEWHKTKGFMRYFNKHFRTIYPRPFLWLIDAGAMARFVVKSITSLPLKVRDMMQSRDLAQAERRQILLQSYANLPLDEMEPPASKGVVLAGATGQVGICILRRLLRWNVPVIAFRHRRVIRGEIANLHWLKADLTQQMLPEFENTVDTFVSTAAIWLLPQHIPELARRGVQRIVCFSSTSVFGKASSANAEEKALVQKFNDAEDEIARLCQEYGIAWTIFRPTLIYGVGLDKNVCAVARFIRRFHLFPIAYPGRGKRQPVHADDLALAVISALANPKTAGKVYNLSGGEELEYREMVARIFQFLGMSPRIIASNLLPVVMDMVARVTGRVDLNGEIARRMNQDLIFSHKEATEDFSYSPRQFLDVECQNLSGNMIL